MFIKLVVMTYAVMNFFFSIDLHLSCIGLGLEGTRKYS